MTVGASSGTNPVPAQALHPMWQGNTNYFVHPNALGSNFFLTNYASSTTEKVLFYPWGQRWATAGTLTDERFASMQQRDAETGNDPTLFRMYESRLYRWLSPDPVAGDVFDPQSLNRYAYVLNNPTTLTDPSGAWPPWTHRDLTLLLFGGVLTSNQVSVLVSASNWLDFHAQDPAYSYLHSMCSPGQGLTGCEASIANGVYGNSILAAQLGFNTQGLW